MTEAGFETGMPVDIRILSGCLVLAAREPAAPQGPEFMQTLRKVCKLSVRKQHQVTEMIEVINMPERHARN